jgi:hypothetical protein
LIIDWPKRGVTGGVSGGVKDKKIEFRKYKIKTKKYFFIVFLQEFQNLKKERLYRR